jgi:type IV pilus assembly protein PilV
MPQKTPCTARRARTTGFAMIEVLVAVLLFAIGILGLVGLQATMTQTQTDSKVRADAANLVDELATLMWSEVTNTSPMTVNLASYTTSGCAGNARCSAWLAKLGEALPGGTLDNLSYNTVTDTNDINHGSVSVTLKWSMPNGGEHKYVAIFNVAPYGE